MAKSRPGPAELEHTPANCHAHEMLTRIGDKWSMYDIHVLGDWAAAAPNAVPGMQAGAGRQRRTGALVT